MDKFLCMTAAVNGAAEGTGFDFTAVFIIISLIVAVALPLGMLIYGKGVKKGSLLMTLWGMLGYVVFYVLLSSALGQIILPKYADQTATYFEGTIYVVLQFVCLELGRFLLLYLNRKKRNELGDAFTFAAGYCIIDAFVIAAFFLIPYLIIVLSPNGGHIDGILREMRVYVQDSNLVAGKEWRFIAKIVTSVTFFAMQTSSTLIMHVALKSGEKFLLLVPLAVDALIMIPNRLSTFDVWYFGNEFVIIPYLLIVSVLCCLLAYVIHRKFYVRKEMME